MQSPLRYRRAAYISDAVVVIDHATDESVRVRLGDAETAFSSLVNGDVQATNAPRDSGPDSPRLLIAGNHKQVVLSDARTQLHMSFEQSDLSMEKALHVAIKNAEQFCAAAARFVTLDESSQVGFIVRLNQPTENPHSEVSQYLADCLYKGKTIGNMNSFEVRLGFETSDALFRNFNFGVYEIRQLPLPDQKNKTVKVRVADIPVAEVGLNCSLDVNNRPRVQAGASRYPFEDSAKAVLRAMEEMATTQIAEFVPAEMFKK